ncbi:uridylate kinase [Halosimplex carlsbadense 2-9-1]|uniref:Uridylate kinase n=1 Tax=Halosimplex carlsbadense 2-9-1 TaxID=797114 RepID=M0D6C7_9EURY|nr:UMP kinase [Halosimplex carlsbadense]ELZ29719.1 uridylate kinase [Halosimplex carlsbadense 2-9-1]
MKTVVSIGGSVLVPSVGPRRVRAYADAVESLDADGYTLGTVVGGGPTAREYIGAARELGANEIELDQLGIEVTRLNGRLLIAALDERAAPTPPESYETGREAIRRGDIPVMGGTVAGQTTDAVSAAFAEYVNADLLVYATSVDGVYDADPDDDPDAAKFSEITADELVGLIADLEMDAGSNAPVDLLAAKIVQRSGIRTVVLDGSDPAAVERAIRTGDHDGTNVVPEGVGAAPPEWSDR